MTEHAHEEQLEIEYCEKHPDREASLRCNRCNRLMCSKCAVRTPTGYRCEDCVRGQQKVFDTAQTQDYVIGPLVGAFLSFIGGMILPNFGFFIVLIGGAFVGSLIAEAVRRSIGRRRSRNLFKIITAAVVLGGLLPALGPVALYLIGILFSGAGFGTALAMAMTTLGYALVWPLVYAILAGAGVYYSLAGLRI